MSRHANPLLLGFSSLLLTTCAHRAVVEEASTPHVSAAASAGSEASALPGAAIAMGENTKLSASIYDGTGQVLRHLYEMALQTGTVKLRWDGKDDMGYDVPDGTYFWRAITTNAVGADDGSVGDLGKAVATQPYSKVENPALVSALTYDNGGNLYVTSIYEESGGTLRRIDHGNLDAGLTSWGINIDGQALGAQAIATDGTYVYVAQYATVLRFVAATGARAPWPGFPKGLSIYPWTKGQMPIPGLTVDSEYVWVVDPEDRKLWVFNKADGTPAKVLGGRNWFSFPRDSPRGIATDGAHSFWIAMAGKAGSLQKWRYDKRTQSMVSSTRIGALTNPYGVAWYTRGATSLVYVTEIGPGHLRQYDVSGAVPVEKARWLSAMPGPGVVTDTALGWQFDFFTGIPGGDAAIAVDPTDGGTIGVVDAWNQRTMFYRTADGSPSTRFMGFNFPAPDVDLAVGQDWLTSAWQQYQVAHDRSDPDYGHPWTLKYNWHPTDDPTGRDFPMDSLVVIRKLSNGFTYLYSTTAGTPALPGGGMVIYRLNADGPGMGMRRVAQIENAPRGPGSPGAGVIEVRTDSNGNGKLDDGQGNEDSGDTVTRRSGKIAFPCVWVDTNGTVWMQNPTLDSSTTWAVGKLPISSFDALDNPVYDVGPSGPLDRVATFRIDGATGIAEFAPSNLRIDPWHKRLFMEVVTPYRSTGIFNTAGSAVYMRDLTTGDTSEFAIPTHALPVLEGPDHKGRLPVRTVVGSLAVDSDSEYFYTGDSVQGGPGQEVRMFTWDGLPVAVATPARPQNKGGWLDSSMSLAAFTHANGNHYAYAEENAYGRNIRYAFSNVATTRRFGGTVSWAAPSTADGLVGWWRLDEQHGSSVLDSSGNHHFGLAVGLSGDAYDWNPVAGWNPTGGLLRGALSFNGKSVNGTMLLLTPSPLAPPDTLIDNPAYSALTFACWVKTTSDGVVLSYQDQRWGTRPKDYIPLMYVGLDGRVRAEAAGAKEQAVSRSTVNDDHWHHLALVVSHSSQTLYVDGSAEATVEGGLSRRGLPYTMVGVGCTDPTRWPETPNASGWFYYGGLLDDLRLYNRALSDAELAALAVPPQPSGPFAWWKFDDVGGALARDSSDHGNDATVAAGTWVPAGGRFGGALSFDGLSTMVTAPNGLVENPAYETLTFACWVKTTAGGVLLSSQDGPYAESAATRHSPAIPLLYIGSDGFVYGGTLGLKSSTPVNTNDWHHVALVIGSRTESIYVDGELSVQSAPGPAVTGLPRAGLLNNQLGAGYSPTSGIPPSWPSDGASFFYKGLLDDARFYGRALPRKEIHDLASLVEAR